MAALPTGPFECTTHDQVMREPVPTSSNLQVPSTRSTRNFIGPVS